MGLLEKIYKAGVVGAGGAGFPSHIKLDCKVDYLIINGAECEPLMDVDKYLMVHKTREIIEAIKEVGQEIEAKHIIIGLKDKYKEQIKKLKSEIESLKAPIELKLLSNFYPAGDEQILTYEITKRVVPEAGIPLDVGVVVSNVGTMYNIYGAIEDRPVIDKYISVIGNVKSPTLMKVPIGARINECLIKAGGTTIDNFSIIKGGPMMGKEIKGCNLDKEVIEKTTGALIVLSKDHYIFHRKNKSIDRIIKEAKSACIQCSLCTEMCPRYLIGHRLRPHKIMRSMSYSSQDVYEKEALLCCECGICELYACPMGLSPRIINSHIKNELAKVGIRHEKIEKDYHPNSMREYRKIPTKRLIGRIDLMDYEMKILEEIDNMEVKEVRIPLKQHIGKVPKRIVNVGDKVKSGDLIGKIERDHIGANVHSSIDGDVTYVDDKCVVIKKVYEVMS